MSAATDAKSWYRAVIEDSDSVLPAMAPSTPKHLITGPNTSSSPVLDETERLAAAMHSQPAGRDEIYPTKTDLLPQPSVDAQDVEVMPKRLLRRTHGSRRLREIVGRSSSSSLSLSSNREASLEDLSETLRKALNGNTQTQSHPVISPWKRRNYPLNDLFLGAGPDSMNDTLKTRFEYLQDSMDHPEVATSTVAATKLRTNTDRPPTAASVNSSKNSSENFDQDAADLDTPPVSDVETSNNIVLTEKSRKRHQQRRRGAYPLQNPASIAELRQAQTPPPSPPKSSYATEISEPATGGLTREARTPHKCNPAPRQGYPLQSPVSIPALQHPPTPPFMVQREIAKEVFDEELPDEFYEVSEVSSFARRTYPLQFLIEPAPGYQAAESVVTEGSRQELTRSATNALESDLARLPNVTHTQSVTEASTGTSTRRAKYPLQLAVSSYARSGDYEAELLPSDTQDRTNLEWTAEPPQSERNETPITHINLSRRRAYPLQSPASRQALDTPRAIQPDQSPQGTDTTSHTTSKFLEVPFDNTNSSRYSLRSTLTITTNREHETSPVAEADNRDQGTVLQQREADLAAKALSQWRRVVYPQQSMRSGPGFDRAPTPMPVNQVIKEQKGPIHLPKNIRAVTDAEVGVYEKSRTIVVCLDGTGDKFDDDNSNIVHIISALKKDDPRQLTYYQAGIGTYSSGGLSTGFEAAADMAVGSGLGVHVRDAYHFLMHSYKEGDKICIFGFSRGAYTARCLAGMIHKVGLLPPRNIQQILFAYEFYKDDTALGWRHSSDFKRTFSTDVNVHFLGCFDSVASVGIIPRQLPLSTTPTNKPRYFRHAMALDERRAKFKVCRHQTKELGDIEKGITHVTTVTKTTATQLMDMLPNHKSEQDVPPKHKPLRRCETDNHPNLTDEEYRDLYGHDEHFETDVLEVWFAGCHADIGGGAVSNDTRHKLAQIPLRWMIRQAFECNTGIIFKTKVLAEYGLDVHTLWPKYKRLPVPSHGPPPSFLERYDSDLPPRSVRRNKLVPVDRTENGEGFYRLASHTDEDWTPEQIEDFYDAMQPLNDQLVQAPSWWILELWPVQYRVPVAPGGVSVRTGMNLGRWRGVDDAEPNLHWTVTHRMQHLGYKIQARTAAHTMWKTVV